MIMHNTLTTPTRLAAQLARTEEAAKRVLIMGDASARGGAAQKLLDAETSLQKLRDENAELQGKFVRWVLAEGGDCVGLVFVFRKDTG